jgi:D-amino-acid dehydrogenase
MQKAIPTSATSATPQVIVVGGGMVGIATAIWVQRTGRSVTLIDKSDARGKASYGNAGVLASSSVLPVTMPGLLGKLPKMLLSPSEPIFARLPYVAKMIPWAMRYLSHATEPEVRRIAAALTPIIGNSLEDHLTLTQNTPARRHIKPCDLAVLYKDRATFEKDPLAWDIRKGLGFTWSENEGEDRTSFDPIFPQNLDFIAALGGHGQITDPGAYMDDLLAHFVQEGGTIVSAQVNDIAHADGHVTGVITDQGHIPATAVAITTGAWSPLLTKKLGVHIPVEAESGYHLEFWNPSHMPRVPTLVPSGKFILSPMEGRLRVAGAVEFGGLKNTGRNAPFAALKRSINKVLPDLTYSKETRWMGHRPAPTDSIPIIDQLPHIKGVFLGFGHQHVGLTGSARTGQILADLICAKLPNIDLTPYRVTRFTRRSLRGPSQTTRFNKVEYT